MNLKTDTHMYLEGWYTFSCCHFSYSILIKACCFITITHTVRTWKTLFIKVELFVVFFFEKSVMSKEIQFLFLSNTLETTLINDLICPFMQCMALDLWDVPCHLSQWSVWLRVHFSYRLSHPVLVFCTDIDPSNYLISY